MLIRTKQPNKADEREWNDQRKHNLCLGFSFLWKHRKHKTCLLMRLFSLGVRSLKRRCLFWFAFVKVFFNVFQQFGTMWQSVCFHIWPKSCKNVAKFLEIDPFSIFLQFGAFKIRRGLHSSIVPIHCLFSFGRWLFHWSMWKCVHTSFCIWWR